MAKSFRFIYLIWLIIRSYLKSCLEKDSKKLVSEENSYMIDKLCELGREKCGKPTLAENLKASGVLILSNKS